MASPRETEHEAAIDLDAPLDEAEERVWRTFARALVVVPRVLEAELQAAHGVTMTEYFVLVNLSEAPDRRLRMSELATRGALSLSAISRVVDGLERRGMVSRERCPEDRRGLLAVLSDRGLACLVEAYPTHLRGVREHVVRHLKGLDLEVVGDAVGSFAGGSRIAETPSCPEPDASAAT
jgi:DNA-binding MarR family transcriptional regulator